MLHDRRCRQCPNPASGTMQVQPNRSMHGQACPVARANRWCEARARRRSGFGQVQVRKGPLRRVAGRQTRAIRIWQEFLAGIEFRIALTASTSFRRVIPSVTPRTKSRRRSYPNRAPPAHSAGGCGHICEPRRDLETLLCQVDLQDVIPQLFSAFSGLSRWDCRPLEARRCRCPIAEARSR